MDNDRRPEAYTYPEGKRQFPECNITGILGPITGSQMCLQDQVQVIAGPYSLAKLARTGRMTGPS
jgi:hypothetical protein